MKKKSRTLYSLRNIFANFAGYGINLILSFVCRMVFVRCLQKEYLGINGLFSNILSMLSLTELGIGTAIIYALYKPLAENDEDKLASLMKFYGIAYKIIGCIVGIFGLCMLPFLDIIIGDQPNITENLHIIYLLYLFNSASSYFFSYRSSILTAAQRNYIVTSISYIFVIIQNVVQMIFLILTKNFMIYLMIQIICTFITNVCISLKAKYDYPFIAKKDIKPLSKEEKKSITKNVKALTVTKLSGLLVNNTDNIVITYFNGLITTGIASNYTLLTNMLSTMLNMIFNSLTASVGNFNVSESEEHKRKFFEELNLICFWLFGWASVGIIICSTDLIRVFFGESYTLSISIPIILAINFYMVGMQTVVLTFKTTLGMFRYGQYIQFVTAVVNIIGDIILGSKYGLLGIYIATAIARVLTVAWYEPYIIYKYVLKQNPLLYLKKYLIYIWLVIMSVIVSYYICKLVHLTGLLKALIDIIICSLITNFIFILFLGKTAEFKKFRNRMVNLKNIEK